MGRRLKHVLCGALLDHAAGIHYRHPAAHTGDQSQIMRDHQDGGALLSAQLLHQIDDLRLHRDVERRRRLVGDQQRRTASQCDRNHDALAHAARELMRVVLRAPLGARHTDHAQGLDGLVLGLTPAGPFVQHEHFRDLAADARQRIQGRHRLLEDHGDAAATQPFQLRLR